MIDGSPDGSFANHPVTGTLSEVNGAEQLLAKARTYAKSGRVNEAFQCGAEALLMRPGDVGILSFIAGLNYAPKANPPRRAPAPVPKIPPAMNTPFDALPLNREQIIAEAESFGLWYHEIELVPGYVTKSVLPGISRLWNSTRKVRDQIDYKGKTVLDLGTMDGLWAFEAEKRGAASVVTADIWQGIPMLGMKRFLLAKEALRSGVILVPNTDVHDLVKRLGSVTPAGGFDIIQNFGMFYHVQNPLLVLHQIRRCLSSSGVMILETACWVGGGDEPVNRLNSDCGIYNDPTSYWIPNMACLMAMLKMTGFEADEKLVSILDDSTVKRITIAVRRVPLARGVDAWGMY